MNGGVCRNVLSPLASCRLWTLRLPGSQSGTELRIRERGVLQKDGSRGDLFFRLMIKIPEATQAVGLKERTQELDKYYESTVRQQLPRTLLE